MTNSQFNNLRPGDVIRTAHGKCFKVVKPHPDGGWFIKPHQEVGYATCAALWDMVKPSKRKKKK